MTSNPSLVTPVSCRPGDVETFRVALNSQMSRPFAVSPVKSKSIDEALIIHVRIHHVRH